RPRRPRGAARTAGARGSRPVRRVGDRLAAVAGRRLPPLHRPLVRGSRPGNRAMTMLKQGVYMMNRHLMNLWRQPTSIALTLVQPIIWLLPYGALFKNVTRIPGFHSHSYIQFLTPGIIVMTALFSSGWSGMAVIDDIDKGILDRFLVSPVKRSALIVGRLLN